MRSVVGSAEEYLELSGPFPFRENKRIQRLAGSGLKLGFLEILRKRFRIAQITDCPAGDRIVIVRDPEGLSDNLSIKACHTMCVKTKRSSLQGQSCARSTHIVQAPLDWGIRCD